VLGRIALEAYLHGGGVGSGSRLSYAAHWDVLSYLLGSTVGNVPFGAFAPGRSVGLRYHRTAAIMGPSQPQTPVDPAICAEVGPIQTSPPGAGRCLVAVVPKSG